MTLIYKIFGIPDTLNEFIDKANRKGEKLVEISPARSVDPDNFDALLGVKLKAGNIKYRLKGNYSFNKFKHIGRASLVREETMLKLLKRTIRVGKYLEKNHNFEVIMDGRTTGETRKFAIEYEKRVLEMKQAYEANPKTASGLDTLKNFCSNFDLSSW